ncbi:hypothetical protein [Amycolatopsis sp. FDAARGOS 1241]|uniref:hypothetical protein n=1 Tax=Amycolatopsis sp. FDAARGOS 1241 TaxID=2778070 RepID=UPI00195065D0|nr:hypothetical protein [Amycolatopsis sp. FDAARGOS 1241]QRP48602.1 hypothetical protein I6J71_12630 [Amycolatopsis sp. FDAARGOS 1241]
MDAVNGKVVLRLPRLVARVDRAMAVAAAVHAGLVLADFVLLGLLAGGLPVLKELFLVVLGLAGPAIGITRHFRSATRDGAGLVIVSSAGSLLLGVLWHFVLGGPGSLRVALRSGVPVLTRVFEVSVTLQVAAAAAALLLAAFAFRRRTSILSIGRIQA